MVDYSELSYYAMKSECKKQGLNSKGKMPILLARLNGTEPLNAKLPVPEIEPPKEDTVDAPPPVPEETKILAPTPDELDKYLPYAVLRPEVDVSRYEDWLTADRLQVLENKLAPLAAGKGTFRFDIDYPNSAFQVSLEGGAQGPISTTLIGRDSQIVKLAQHYFTARLSVGKNNQTSRA